MFVCKYENKGCAKVKWDLCKDKEFADKCPYAAYFKYLEENFKDKGD